MTAPRDVDAWSCSEPKKLTCYGTSHDGCAKKETTHHLCVPDELHVGAACGGALITCGYGQVDTCKWGLGNGHLCVVIPDWVDQANGKLAEIAQVTNTIDTLLDIDQPREQKPGGSWTDQQYIGPKQYDKLFIQLDHEAPSVEPPTGPLAHVDRIELMRIDSPTPLATIARADLYYNPESRHDFAQDVGVQSFTSEHMKFSLGTAVGDYVKSAHPFELVVRGRTADGKLVFTKTLTGDEAGDYPTIVPPRPY
jgi:hypothetical protein